MNWKLFGMSLASAAVSGAAMLGAQYMQGNGGHITGTPLIAGAIIGVVNLMVSSPLKQTDPPTPAPVQSLPQPLPQVQTPTPPIGGIIGKSSELYGAPRKTSMGVGPVSPVGPVGPGWHPPAPPAPPVAPPTTKK